MNQKQMKKKIFADKMGIVFCVLIILVMSIASVKVAYAYTIQFTREAAKVIVGWLGVAAVGIQLVMFQIIFTQIDELFSLVMEKKKLRRR